MTAKQFKKNAAPTEIMDTETYRAMLEKLVTQGKTYGKTEPVGAYQLKDIKLVTERSAGGDETAQDISVEPLYLVLDPEIYNDIARPLVVKDMAENWGQKLVHERDLDSPDFKGPGIWLQKAGNLEFDYVPAAEGEEQKAKSLFKPNDKAYRVTLQVEQDVKIPVPWAGGFVVKKGGTIAIRERDVPQLVQALEDIKAGNTTAEDALFKTDDQGNKVTTFDVYGMEPGFCEKNYNPIQPTAANTNAAKLKPKK